MNKFKVMGVGIDTTHLDYTPGEEFDFDYIFTSITANNESVLRDYSPGASLITYIDFLDKSDEAINNHLDLLGKDSIDLLLIDANCNFKKYVDTVNSSLVSGAVESVGIYGPTSIDQVKEIQEVLPNLKYIGLEICPLNFNYELITWAQENNIDIIGFNPFGGHISAAGMIDSFSAPYLLGFASTYCTLVFLSGRDVFTAADDRGYIVNLIDQETSDIYKLDKSVNNLYKPFKRAVGVSIKLDSNHVLPLNNQRAIFAPSDLDIKLGEAVEDVKDFDIFVGSVIDNVYSFYQDFKIPEDTESDAAILSLIKTRVIELIKKEDSDLEVSFRKLGENILIINTTKKIKGKVFKRTKKVLYENYLLSVNNKSLEFCELFASNPEIAQSANNSESNS